MDKTESLAKISSWSDIPQIPEAVYEVAKEMWALLSMLTNSSCCQSKQNTTAIGLSGEREYACSRQWQLRASAILSVF